MIRDAILTCAQKPTWVSLIYHTEPTTKKLEKLESRKQICSEITVNSLGNPCSKSWRRKREGCGGKDLQKRKVLQTIANNGWHRSVKVGHENNNGWLQTDFAACSFHLFLCPSLRRRNTIVHRRFCYRPPASARNVIKSVAFVRDIPAIVFISSQWVRATASVLLCH